MLQRTRKLVLFQAVILFLFCLAASAQQQGSPSADPASTTTPKELYTIAILATFAGSSGAVLVVYNTFRILLKRDNLWVAFVIALVVAYVVAAATGGLKLNYGYFLAFLNGCLLFTTAAGGQEIIARPPALPAAAEAASRTRAVPSLRSSWFRR